MKSDKRLSHIKSIKTWLGSGSINIFGSPFSGKDTQAHLLSKPLGAEVIAGGDILRSHPEEEKVKKLMASGKLFPSDFYLSVILPYLDRSDLEGKPLILSSVGRWHGEEKVVMKAAAKAGHPVKAVVFLNLKPETVRDRFIASRQTSERGIRHDDVGHLIDVRLQEFRDKTLPVIEYYKDKKLLIEVDGSDDRNNVAAQVLEKLNKLATA